MTKLKAILCAFLAALFYAVNIPLSKLLLKSVEPTTMAALLYLGAGIGVGIMLLVKGGEAKKFRTAFASGYAVRHRHDRTRHRRANPSDVRHPLRFARQRLASWQLRDRRHDGGRASALRRGGFRQTMDSDRADYHRMCTALVRRGKKPPVLARVAAGSSRDGLLGIRKQLYEGHFIEGHIRDRHPQRGVFGAGRTGLSRS